MKCRACLKIGHVNTSPLDEYYVICFNLITTLNIKLGDNKPQQLCENCLGDLIRCISFREKCIYSNSKLVETVSIEETTTKSQELRHIKVEDNNINFEIDCIEKLVIEGEEIDKTELDEASDVDNFKYEYAEGTKDSSNFEEQSIEKTEKKQEESNINKEKSYKSVIVYDCGLCKEQCTKGDLYDHVESHKSSKWCPICDKEFLEWSLLSLHRVKHLPTTRLFCHICFKYVKTPASLEVHYSLKHMRKNPKSVLQCQQCTKSYTTLRGLQKHMWTMHSGQTYVCDICNKEYNCKKMLVYHIKTWHAPRTTYRCKECDFISKFPGNLKQHIINKHTPGRVYCSKCKTSYENQSKFQGHKCRKRLPTVCPICGIVLSPHARLNRHLVMHTTERQFKCTRCPASYKSKTALDTHLDKHDGRRTRHCEYCPASFYEQSALIRHRRTHTGEKPYVCKICQKAFAGLHNLKVHMQVHGEFLIKKKSMENSMESVREIFKPSPCKMFKRGKSVVTK